MTTGDLKNNLRKLISELKHVNHPQTNLDIKGLAQGTPRASLPIVHHVFLEYSYSLAQYFASRGYELYGKTDLRFLEVVYKVLRDEFGYKPQLTKDQFLSIGFAERKIIFLCNVLKLLREKHDALNPKGTEKSEKKKAKNAVSAVKASGVENAKENMGNYKSVGEKFPGPLPVNTEMRDFRSNEAAAKAGLGHKEPLVMRMIDGSAEDVPLSKGFDPQVIAGKGVDSFPSNLVVRTNSGDQRFFGVKFPVSQNSEVRATLSRQPHPKSVTWEDEILDGQSQTNKPLASDATAQVVPQSYRPGYPISVLPARIHSRPNEILSPVENPTHKANTNPEVTSTVQNADTRPSPVAMTTIPIPSQDLMLTPNRKVAHAMPIPLSSTRHEHESPGVSHLNLKDSVLPPAKVVRHTRGDEGNENGTLTSSLTSDQVYVLQQQLQELQEKFDGMVLSNNEMSARVVLLESRLKLLEERNERNLCSKCSNQLLHSTSQVQCERRVVAGYEVRSSRGDSADKPSFDSHTHPYRNGDGKSDECMTPLKQNSSRQLFADKPTSWSSADSPSNKNMSVSNSIGLDNGNRVAIGYHWGVANSPVAMVSPSRNVSELFNSPTATPDLVRAFTDSATKNTVINAHRRLRETKEMLARTNRDFAAKFDEYE